MHIDAHFTERQLATEVGGALKLLRGGQNILTSGIAILLVLSFLYAYHLLYARTVPLINDHDGFIVRHHMSITRISIARD